MTAPAASLGASWSAALAQQDDFGSILQLLFVAVFFVLVPIVRSIKEAKKKQAAEQARRAAEIERTGGTLAPPPASPAEPKELGGRELWEQLLRGELEAPAPPVRMPPPLPRTARGDAPLPPEYAEVLTEAPTLEAPPLPESLEGPSPYERQQPGSAKVSTMEAPPPFAGEAFEALRPTLESGEEAPLAQDLSIRSLATELHTLQPVSVGPRRRGGVELARTRQDWRAALVLSEVLAPPVALRTGPSWPGSPPGLA